MTLSAQPQAGSPDRALVCFALPDEAAPFRRLVAAMPGVRVLVTGVGPRNAERALRAALGPPLPELVLTCGYAGGLDPDLRAGDVVFCADDAELKCRLLGAGAREARFECVERILPTAAEKLQLRQATGADAVEMESGVIRRLCRELGVPAATVRVISDPAHEDLPLDFNRVMTADQRLDPARLAGAVLRSPGRVPALLRLQRQTRRAARRLAEMLGAVLAESGAAGRAPRPGNPD